MATTYTNDLGIKKIGVGLESGTWGSSTSQSFERLSDAMGRAVSLDIESLPTGSTSVTGTGSSPSKTSPTDGTWLLLDSADSLGTSSDSGSEGRCSAVEFTDTAYAASQDITILIRGNTSTTNVNRTFVVWNNLQNGNLLKLDCAGGEITIQNGCLALINTNPTGVGGWGTGGSAGVANLLSKAQFDDIVLAATASTLEFVGTGSVRLKDNSSTALVIGDSAQPYVIKVNTTTGTEVVVFSGTSIARIDLADGQTNPAIIQTLGSATEALKITDGSNAAITVDNSNNQIEIGDAVTSKSLRVFGNVVLSDQAADIEVIDNTSAALEIKEGANLYIGIDTTDGSEKIDLGKVIEVPDIALTGSDGYINATTTKGSSGYGLRNNSGTMQTKHSGGSWAKLGELAIGAQAIAAASTAGTANQQGSLNFGPFRLVFNTVAISSGTDTITLGDAGEGTSASMASGGIYTVMATEMGTSVSGNNVVVDVTGTNTFTLRQGSATDVTYWAIGDSGN